MTTQNEFFDLFILRRNPSKWITYFFDNLDTFGLTTARCIPQVIYFARMPNQYDHDVLGDGYQYWMGPTFVSAAILLMGAVGVKFTNDQMKLWIKSQLTDEFLVAYYFQYYYKDGNLKKDLSEEERERVKKLEALINNNELVEKGRRENLQTFALKLDNDVQIQNIISKNIQGSSSDSNPKIDTDEKIRWYWNGTLDFMVHFAYSHWTFWMIGTVIMYQIIDGYSENPENPDRSNFSGAFTEGVVGHGSLLWLQCFFPLLVAIVLWYYSKYKEDEERDLLFDGKKHSNLIKGRGWAAIFAPFRYLWEDRFLEAKRAEEEEGRRSERMTELRTLYLKKNPNKEKKQVTLDKDKKQVTPEEAFASQTQYTRVLTAATKFLGAFLLFNIAAWPITVFAEALCGVVMGDPDSDHGAPGQTLTFFATVLLSVVFAKYADDDLKKDQNDCRTAIAAGYDPRATIGAQNDQKLSTFWWGNETHRYAAFVFFVGRFLGNGGYLLARILMMGGGGNVISSLMHHEGFDSKAIYRGISDHHFDDNLMIMGLVLTVFMITLNLLQYRRYTQLQEIKSEARDHRLRAGA